MVPEVEVPIGAGSFRCCWVCAHMIVDHGAEVGDAINAECGCAPEAIYPDDVLRLRVARSPLLCTERTSYADCAPTPPRTHTIVSRCYDLDTGKAQDGGPKLVQVFEEVGPGMVKLQSVTVREPTRGERMARKQHERQVSRKRQKIEVLQPTNLPELRKR